MSEPGRVTADWLALREPADAAARAPDLAEVVRLGTGPTRPVVVHDLGAGTGSMARWLAPRLPGPQHWILYDQDAELLARATTSGYLPGVPVTVETRRRDVTRLTAADLSGAALLTASALLDMLTADEIERVAAACAGAGCPALLTLSVTGRVELTPPEPLDAEIEAAFNEHQRRTTNGRSLLGPAGAAVAAAAFARRGIDVRHRASPWRLRGTAAAGLIGQWLRGWLAAACEQRPELAGPSGEYARRRQAELAAGRLEVVVDHQDLLAGPSRIVNAG